MPNLQESGRVGDCKDGADVRAIQACYSSHFIAFCIVKLLY